MAKKPQQDFEDLFVSQYLIDLNSTQAYLRARPEANESTARSEGARYLAKPSIQKKISDAKAARSKRTGLTQDRVVRELSRIAFSKKPDCMGWNFKGNRLRMTSKVKALEVLLEHLAKANEDAAKSQPTSFVDLMREAHELEEAEKKKGNA